MHASTRTSELSRRKARAGASAQPRAREAHACERAGFDAVYDVWLARVYRFAAARLPDSARAEAATRATLEGAVRAGLLAAPGDPTAQLLGLLKLEISRQLQAPDT